MRGALDRLGWRLRPFVPRQVKWLLRPLLGAVDPIAVAAYRRRTGERRPIPPRRLRAAVGSPSIERYFAAGHGNAAGLLAALRHLGREIGEFESVLDFGCGCGRTLQNLTLADGPTFHGCDVDEQAIEWAARHLEPARFEVNGFAPPLPYADDSFDLIYAISVFTHLAEENQFEWLRELARVSRPGGVCLLSIHGEVARRWNWHHMGVPRRLASHLVEELPRSSEPFL